MNKFTNFHRGGGRGVPEGKKGRIRKVASGIEKKKEKGEAKELALPRIREKKRRKRMGRRSACNCLLMQFEEKESKDRRRG